jgi:multicomponent Na+:H+ antiporter subunit D
VATIFFLLTGLIGVVMTTDLFNLFVFVEISSVSAYVLVAFRGGELELEASLKYMILGTITGLLFLTGIATMYDQVGALNMGAIAEGLSEKEGENVVVEFSTLLILIGVGLPAAIFPLHTWLADAHSRAPSAVSALLSGASVQVAIYAMVRLFYQSFGLGSVGVLDLLPWAGLATAIFGALLALVQTDLKRLLAYTTVSSGGFSLLLISMASEVGFESLFMHLVNHAMAKTLLFLTAGTMIHVFSTREIHNMRGAWGRAPWLCSAFILGAVCDFGGPSLGFFGKAKMFLGLADGGWLTIAVVGAAVVLVAASYLRVIQVLVSAENGMGNTVKSTPRTMVAPIVVLVVICIILGLSAWTIQDQAGTVAAQIIDRLEMVASMMVI